ncbi:MAG: bifunctional salicylyl-CoA 5-hydroxylase/oxidoreductase [Candidatus Rokubacteria bacterium]|nr:bifunctional salicylyl-CoA 5-hydroxylase/oxidoreductase [Candidatus Rokubacteria bacterium]MBI3824438.1 bifunctional salicylyl-CoA 5-hydroxylase/oxidoreductase [Candidatus Rokubacteria bacterium]
MGGGPAGLYFAALMKTADPRHDVTVLERNRPDDTFGFGVVFSDATLEEFAAADRPTHEAITRSFAHWDDIDIHYQDQVISSTGHGFSGLSRQVLLDILQRRCAELGVTLRFSTEASDLAPYLEADLVLAADGVNSLIRSRYAERFGPVVDWRPNKFVWLGTTCPFPAFTFIFKEDVHGLWRVHAYRYMEGASTFIVETTEQTWHRAGLGSASEDDTLTFCEELFAKELEGHRLQKNRSLWRSFPTVRNARWHWKNVVLVGDAAHTAHFSIGSGTKLAMEDAIALGQALGRHPRVEDALAAYEMARRPQVEAIQRAAQASLEWFEDTERYHGRLEPQQFAFSLLTRSLRVTHENLRVRDPRFVASIDRWFAERAATQAGVAETSATGAAETSAAALPPMFTPFRLRGLLLANRVVVSPMCQYSAEDGTPEDWHLVHLGSRALGGAGLVITEMTDVSREGRISPGCAGMYKPEHVVAWRRIVDFVHRWSGAAIGMQLAHAGRKGATKLFWEGHDRPLAEGGWPVISASALPYFPDSPVPKEMDRGDMDTVLGDFVRAARMANQAGFDMLELHCAHGYLLASFLSSLTNRRTDAYGGSLAHRMHYPIEVFDAVRAAWPPDKPLSVRISATDWADGGTTPAEAVEFARALRGHGCDVVDVSSGNTVPDDRPRYGRLYQTPFSDRIRHEVGMPTMTVGAIASPADVNGILAAGRADLCVLARAHLYDPYWTRHAAWAQGVELPWPDQYLPVRGFTPRDR